MSPKWHSALAFALVGVRVELVETGQPDPQELLVELASMGWDPVRISDHAHEMVAAERPWPHPVPRQLRDGCGAAQFHASVNRARQLLKLESLETLPPSERQELNSDEVRLLREVPPHHGH
jgi:hypothetical protein